MRSSWAAVGARESLAVRTGDLPGVVIAVATGSSSDEGAVSVVARGGVRRAKESGDVVVGKCLTFQELSRDQPQFTVARAEEGSSAGVGRSEECTSFSVERSGRRLGDWAAAAATRF